MLTTNKIKPKHNIQFDKFLEVEKDDKGEPTGNIISNIPRDVFTTSQDRVKNKPARVLPRNFTDVRRVEQKKPERTFLQSADIEDMRRRAKAQATRAAKEAAELNRKPKKSPGRQGKKGR